MSIEEKLDAIARHIGYIDYPTDSVECGRYWHTAGHGRSDNIRISKRDWQPHKSLDLAMSLLHHYRMKLKIDMSAMIVLATLPGAHSKYENSHIASIAGDSVIEINDAICVGIVDAIYYHIARR